MSHRIPRTRRRMLELTGSAVAIGLAGCTSSGGDDDPTEEDDHHDGTDEQEGDHHDDDHGHDHDVSMPDEPLQAAEVALQTEDSEYHFVSHVTWIEPGGTVTWTLESGSHDVAAYHPDNDRPLRMPEDADPWASDLLTEEGDTFEHTFDTAGVYDYFCTPHESVGMVGTVLVGEPDPHEQAALEEPSDSIPEAARNELGDLAEKVESALEHDH